jgi:hypothetical protein
MNDPLKSILQPPAKTNSFPINSRYNGINTAILKKPDGQELIYLRRRFISQPGRFVTLYEHTVVQGDRLDNITAHYLGDPEQFWRICDANAVMRTEELTENAGRKIRITLPEGIAGGQNV